MTKNVSAQVLRNKEKDKDSKHFKPKKNFTTKTRSGHRKFKKKLNIETDKSLTDIIFGEETVSRGRHRKNLLNLGSSKRDSLYNTELLSKHKSKGNEDAAWNRIQRRGCSSLDMGYR